jgi:hypothetical protein
MRPFASLPKGYVPVQDYAAVAALMPTENLAAALLHDGVPLMQMRVGSKKATSYVLKADFDRWFLANLQPVVPK